MPFVEMNIPSMIISTNQNNDQDPSFELLVGLDWNFNAYGGPKEGCYWPCIKDQQVAAKTCDLLSKYYNNTQTITREKIDIILEGGSFHTDGQGTILTTEEC